MLTKCASTIRFKHALHSLFVVSHRQKVSVAILESPRGAHGPLERPWSKPYRISGKKRENIDL